MDNRYFIDRQKITESGAMSYPRKFPFALKSGKGSWVEDVEGNRYLDVLCGAGTLALGHNDDEINKTMVDLIGSGIPLHTLDLTTPVKDEFVTKIMSLLPEGMQGNSKIQFCSPSGSDAVDAAIKLCKTATGRDNVIAFSGAYHGMGHGALALTGTLGAKEQVTGLMSGVHFLPYPYSYRCPFGLGGEAGERAAANYFERILKDPESGITKPAAVILEPIQGEGGVIPAPVEFLKTVRRVTRELDIPLIVDEIQCGVGRSGKFFAFEYADIEPDVILVSKAIGGSQPLAVVIYNKNLDKWEAGAHAGTFRGNQLAMKAGLVVMNRVADSHFLEDVNKKGTFIREGFLNLKEKYNIIGDVRGKGLMVGIEIINPKETTDHLGAHPGSGELAVKLQAECFKRGLIMEKGGRHGAVMRCLCALNITMDELQIMFNKFEEALIEVEKGV